MFNMIKVYFIILYYHWIHCEKQFVHQITTYYNYANTNHDDKEVKINDLDAHGATIITLNVWNFYNNFV